MQSLATFLSRNKTLILAFIFFFLFSVFVKVFAAAPSGGYDSGATLDPDCEPGETAPQPCIVKGGGWIGSTTNTGTEGSVLFVDSSQNLAEDNANFFWDDTNDRLGIGTVNPAAQLDIATNSITPSRIILSTAIGGYFLNTWGGGSSNRFSIGRISPAMDDFVLSEGNAGLGTTAPTTNFQVAQRTTGVGTVATNGTTTLTGTGTQFLNTFKVGDTITVSGETARTIATISSNTILTVTVAFSNTDSGLSYTLAGGNRFAVLGNGNVGIGTTTPNQKLEVADIARFTIPTNPDSYTDIYGGRNIRIYRSSTDTAGDPGLFVFSDGVETASVEWDDELLRGIQLGVASTAPGVKKITLTSGVTIGSGYLTTAPPVDGLLIEGNVGIGTTIPGSLLHLVTEDVTSGPDHTGINLDVYGSTAANFIGKRANGTIASPTVVLSGNNLTTFGAYGYGTSGFQTEANGLIRFKAAENFTDSAKGTNLTFELASIGDNVISEKMRLTSEGFLGIGTTTPTVNLDIVSTELGSAAATGITQYDSVASPQFFLQRANGSLASPTAVTNNQTLGDLSWRGYTGSAFTGTKATLQVKTAEDWSPTANGTNMIFYTTPVTTTTLTERARLTSEGYFGINNSSPSVALDVTGDIEYTGDLTDVSDERLKENITEFTGGLELIRQIGVKNYNMISSPNKEETGFIAQNINEIFPQAVSIVDPENGYMGVSYVSFIPVLAQAVQELDLKIEAIRDFEDESFVSKLQNYFADAANRIEDLFLNRVHTRTLCIGEEGDETCITKSELDALLEGQNVYVDDNEEEEELIPEEGELDEEIVQEEDVEENIPDLTIEELTPEEVSEENIEEILEEVVPEEEPVLLE